MKTAFFVLIVAIPLTIIFFFTFVDNPDTVEVPHMMDTPYERAIIDSLRANMAKWEAINAKTYVEQNQESKELYMKQLSYILSEMGMEASLLDPEDIPEDIAHFLVVHGNGVKVN